LHGRAGNRGARGLIDESITPIWEANHVWLVFDLVIFWTAFPRAFASVMTALALPIWLAAGGIVLRGAGFAFRKEITRLGQQRVAGAAFAFSSLLTPFFMGTVVGAIATGGVPAKANHASLAAWTSPTALLAGFLFVASCGYLAAVYLIAKAGRRGDLPMRAYFTRRAQVAAIVAGVLSLGVLFELRNPDPALYARLTGRELPLVVLAGVCGLAVLALITAGRPTGSRIIAALGVAAVIWGWGGAQYPVLLPGTAVTLTNAGATQATFVALVVVAIAAAILVVPSFALLYSLQGRHMLGGGEQETLTGPQPRHSPPTRRATADWPQVRSGSLMAGGILIGIGAVAALAGAAVAGTHVVAATRAWIRELETPPDQLARLRWEQAKAAAAAGASAWRGHPNAEVRLARRDSSASN
jgi:cytochrome d ubiquinol oxidase subunit II